MRERRPCLIQVILHQRQHSRDRSTARDLGRHPDLIPPQLRCLNGHPHLPLAVAVTTVVVAPRRVQAAPSCSKPPGRLKEHESNRVALINSRTTEPEVVENGM